MDKNKKNYYKKKLLQEKNLLLDELNNYNNEKELSLKESTNELSSYDNHPGDQASNTLEREMNIGFEDNIQHILKKIEAALKLIDKENYGICQECKQKIDGERLETIPYTVYCRKCITEKEISEDLETERPIEEEVLKDINSKNFKEDNIHYDKEDSWEDVARYGTSSDNKDDIE